MIILDTDAITFLERRGSLFSKQLRDRLTALSAEHDIVTTIITYEEQTRGWFKKLANARTPDAEIESYGSLLEHLNMVREINVVAYTKDADTQFRRLRSLKIRVGTMDLRIAAIALSHDAILLTRNLRDFQRVPNLRVEDWAHAF
jgi:tRNA(fMet)-specific endonuclease VapC